MHRLSDRIVGSLVALCLVLIVVAGVGGYQVRAQENATLEQRVAALEANAIPRSPNLTWNGGWQAPEAFFSNPDQSAFLICVTGDPLASLNPLMQQIMPPGLTGYRCEIAPPRLP